LFVNPSNSHERKDINTATTDNSLKESNRHVNATDNHLRESINHLKEVNKELITKYNKQKEFISIAAHELRSPIVPLLGTLELIEYEFEEAGKKEITLKKEYFERLVRNTNRLERLAPEILDITTIDDKSLKLKKEHFNLSKIVLDAIEDHRRQLEKSNGNTKILYEFKKEKKKYQEEQILLVRIFS
jgi:signal transduction histidine kinase